MVVALRFGSSPLRWDSCAMTPEPLRHFRGLFTICLQCPWHETATVSLPLRHQLMLRRSSGREWSKQMAVAVEEWVFMSVRTALKLSQAAQMHQHCQNCDESREKIRWNCRRQPSGLIKCCLQSLQSNYLEQLWRVGSVRPTHHREGL